MTEKEVALCWNNIAQFSYLQFPWVSLIIALTPRSLPQCSLWSILEPPSRSSLLQKPGWPDEASAMPVAVEEDGAEEAVGVASHKDLFGGMKGRREI